MLGDAAFDAAVSVESLHHFTKKEKISLYRRLYIALRPPSEQLGKYSNFARRKTVKNDRIR